jgi:DNA-binding MarR family transcriptional regulator
MDFLTGAPSVLNFRSFDLTFRRKRVTTPIYLPRGLNVNLSDRSIRREIGTSCACFNLRRAARLISQKFDQAFRGAGITANQFSILMASYSQEGILLTKMAKILGMERTTLSRNLSLLESKKMVSIATGGDKRERRIAITKEGISSLERALPLWQKAQKEVLEKVGPVEWEGLLAGLHKVARNI